MPFETQPDLGGEWGLSADDQRHRAVFNGIWQVGHGFQVSGLHFFAAGIRLPTNYGGDQRNTVRRRRQRPPAPERHDRPAQRASSPRRRTERTCGCSSGSRWAAGRRSTAIAEIFNMFNRPNYTLGTQESTPTQYLSRRRQVRTMQFGFRFTF